MNVKSKIVLLLLSVGLVWGACRKADRQTISEESTPVIKESRFFTEHSSANPQVQSIIQWLQTKNAKDNFVTKTVEQIGYPRWDKVLIQASNSNRLSHRGGTDTSFNLYFIPFVRDS